MSRAISGTEPVEGKALFPFLRANGMFWPLLAQENDDLLFWARI